MKPVGHHFLSKLLICSLLICSAVFASDTNEITNLSAWQTAPSLPYAVQEIYPVFYEGDIVIAGGLSPDVNDNPMGVSDRVVAFNVDTQVWFDAPSLPEPRHHPMLVVVGDRLLSFGGFTADDNGVWHNSTDVLELLPHTERSNSRLLTNGTWQTIAQMPAPLAETLSAVHHGKVHLVSGRTPKSKGQNSQWNDQTDVASHYIFDPKALSWSEGTEVPTARNSACSVQLNGNWHTIAGRTVAGGNLASHEVYNFAQKTWQKLASLPAAQGGLACATIKRKIYVFGGEFFDNGGGVYSDVWEYDSAADSWRSVSKMPKPRHGLGALSVNQNEIRQNGINNSIYVIAGALQAGGNQTSALMSVFIPIK